VEQTTGPGIARGQGGEVVLTGSDGRRYVLEPLEPAALRRQLRKDLREAEALLRSRRAPPVEAIQAHLRDLAAFPALQAEFLDRAWRDMKSRDAPVGDREIRDWLDSHEGMVWSMTRALRRRHPELTKTTWPTCSTTSASPRCSGRGTWRRRRWSGRPASAASPGTASRPRPRPADGRLASWMGYVGL
jgi:hypothetical protein